MKHLTLIIGLLWALGASGQIFINSYRFGAAPSANLLLDDYPNAAGAYSLRLLRTGYTGDCVEVRRSSDNTTSNIGFSGGVIDTATLKTFCSGTNCFVRTWYDQSTNGRNATQTTNASQPQIVASGALFYENSQVAIDFNSYFFNIDTSILSIYTGSFSFYSAMKTTSAPNNRALFSFQGTNSFLFYPNITVTTTGARVSWTSVPTQTLQESPSVSINDSNLLYSFNSNQSTGDYIVSRNSVTVITRTGTGSTTTAKPVNNQIGAFNSGSLYIGKIQELIIYNSDQTSNRTGIEGNINSFYNIY